MDQPFDHGRDDHEPLDSSSGSAPLSIIERAMHHVSAKPAVTIKPASRHVSLLDKVRTPAPVRKEQEEAKTETPKLEKKITRRGFFRNMRDTAIAGGAIYAGYKGYDTLYGPSNTGMGLLKMDTEHAQLGLVHRRRDLSRLAFDDRDGADALTLAKSGLESLLISPELTLMPKQDESTIFRGSADRNNTDGQVARLQGSARNIYIPYHLFEKAVDFRVRVRTDMTGKRFLNFSMSGDPEAKDLPITTDIANVAQNTTEAVTDGTSSLAGKFAAAWDEFKEFTGLAKDEGVDHFAEQRARHDREVLDRERAKPHPQVDADFSFEMDYPADGVLPNLHFYNGKTLEEPTFHILSDDLRAGLVTEENGMKFAMPTMRIIANDGIVYDSSINNGVGKHQNVRYYDSRLAHAAQAAMLHPDSRIENGVLKQAGTGLYKFGITDNKLNQYEEAALALAGEQIERSEDGRWSLKDRFAHRVMGTPDEGIGR